MKKIIFLITICIVGVSLVSASYESFVNVVGVDNHGNGIMGNVTVEIQEGKGRVLVDTTPLQGIYTQDSERIAVEVAADITGFDFSEYDVIYSIVTDNAHVIDGPSAGGALTLATVAAIEEREISRNFAMTGTIEEDGNIGPVGEVLVKTKAAADHGVTVFLIPEGQAVQNQYVRKIKTPSPGWYIETIEPVRVNVIEYAEEKWSMKVYEVSDINEAIEYAFGDIPEKEANEIAKIEENITLPNFTSPVSDYNDFSWMVSDELTRAESNYRQVSEKLQTSQLPGELKSTLSELMKNSEEYLRRSQEIEGQGYAYSSANEAFKSLITSNVVNDLINYYSSGDQSQYIENNMEEIKSEIAETKDEVLIKTNKMICDPKNFEWAVAARQRIIYAENRVASIEEEGGINPVEIFYKINTAREWVEISKNFIKKTTHRDAGTECLENFEEQAETLVKEAENQMLLESSMGYDIESIKWYLDAAKAELEGGWYVTAIYDAISTKTRARVGSNYQNKAIEEIYSDFNEMEIVTGNLLGTIFLENAYYNIYRAVEENSKSDAVLAIQTLVLAEEISEIHSDIKNNMGRPSFDWSVDWGFDFGIDKEDYITVLVIVVVVLVLYVIILTARIQRLEKKFRIGKKGRKKRLK